MQGRKISEEAKAGFLDGLRRGLSVAAAARQAGFSRWGIYRVRANDAAFAAAWEDALAEGTDLLEDELRRRAVEGVAQPVFHQGRQVATVHRPSDRLLVFLLRTRRPGVYRDSLKLADAEAGRHEDALTDLDTSGETGGEAEPG